MNAHIGEFKFEKAQFSELATFPLFIYSSKKSKHVSIS